MRRRNYTTGSLPHLGELSRRLHLQRPVFRQEDIEVLTALIAQETARRMIILSDRRVVEKLGLKLDWLEFPEKDK